MEWYWIVLLVMGGIGIGLLIAYTAFIYMFKDMFG